MKFVFWISVAVAGYTYAVYPLLLFLLAGLHQMCRDLRFAFSRGERRRHREPAGYPLVSLIFSAYNEEEIMARKMANCAALDYPRERIEVLVGCDGCSDGTAAVARSAGLPNARILEYSPRSGKLLVLNRLVEEARGEFVVFSDASTLLEPEAVRSLLRHFADPAVGCVCGDMRLFSPAGAPQVEGLYWRYEVFLKFLESRLGMLLGANGGVYAIRRRLYAPLPRQAIVDDFLVAMNIRAGGFRLVYDPEAVAYEEVAPGLGDEFRRRTRIGAGNFHALRLTAGLLSPLAGRVAFSYWSHKICRWLVPFALVSALLSALWLARQPFYLACAAALLGSGGLALIGHRLARRNRHSRWLAPLYYFFSMNLALLIGFFRFLRDTQGSVWERTARAEAGAAPPGAAPRDDAVSGRLSAAASGKGAGSGRP